MPFLKKFVNNSKNHQPAGQKEDTSTPSPLSNSSASSTPEYERLLTIPPTTRRATLYLSPSTEELGCYFTISSTGSTYTSESPAAVPEAANDNQQQQKSTPNKMSQDAEDGPEVVFVEPTRWRDDAHAHLYNASRPPMNQDEFDKRFNYRPPPDIDAEMRRRSKKFVRHYYRPCMTGNEFYRFILRLIPILEWLPRYSWRQNLLSDFVGGIIVGVMHVPQGIAYAKLAGVDAVVGLYISFLPPLFYMIFGTSRHNSIGSFAVVALMSGVAVNRLSAEYKQQFDDDQLLMATDSDMNATMAATAVDSKLLLVSPLVVSSTLACCVGLIQILMGVLRLELITTYFSDQVVAGFTTGASFHVFVAQLPDIFGLKIHNWTGAGYLFKKLGEIFAKLGDTNLFTLALSAFALLFLCVGKEAVNPWLKRRHRLNVPIPFELILMIFATAISALFHFKSQHQVKIVGNLPTELPMPMLPNFSLMPQLLPEALGIAAVVVAVHISLAKMFAKKMAYRVDPAQELFALGFSSSLASFFPAYPVSCSLGRTLVNVEAGTKTQFSTVFSSALLAAIILYFGQWLRTLPRCILSAIICVALKGIFKKFADLRTLWPLSKIDFSIWLVSFLATVCWDVTEGLAVAICFALMTTVFRTQWPRWHFLANLSGTNDFRDSERYEMVCTYPGICIFRFDSPLLFTNVDNFRETIHKAFRRWNRYQDAQLGGAKPKKKTPATTALVPADLLSPMDAMKQRRPNGKANGRLETQETDNVSSQTGCNGSSDEESDVLAMDTQQQKQRSAGIAGCIASPLPPLPQIVVENGDVETTMNGQQIAPPPYFAKTLPICYRHFIVDCSGFTFVDCMGVNALKEIFTEMRAQRVLVYFAAAKVPVRDLFEKCGFYQYVQKHNFYPTIRDAVAIARKRRNASTQHLLDEPTERQYDAMDTAQSVHPMS